jgi:pyocin large subunit-like protein
MLERDREALPRLDSIRKAILVPERATLLEMILEVFRPNLPAWTVLAFAWIVLAAVHFATSPDPRHTTRQTGGQPDLVNLTITHDEALSLLDSHS